MNERLIHDSAWAIATAILEIFDDLISEDQKPIAFNSVYEIEKAGLEAYEIHNHRMNTRIYRPRNN